MAAPKIKTITVGDRTRYRFVVDVGTDPATGRRKQLTRTHDRLRDAQRDLAALLTEVNTGRYVGPSKITVTEHVTEWLRSATRGKEAATARSYGFALKPVTDRLGAVLLRKLTRKHIEDLVEWMSEHGSKRSKGTAGVGPRSIRLTLSLLRSALNEAVDARLIEYNPAARVKCPEQSGTDREPWSDSEVKVFLASLTGDRLHSVMLLSLMGLRPAEVCGLRWSDVDLDAGTLKIENTRTLVGGVVIEKGPKSASGRRTLPLPHQVITALRALRANQAADRLAAGPGTYQETGYVLVDELGAPRRTAWLRQRAYALMQRAGVRKVRLYDARHACLTYLRMSGVPGPTVSAWAGHSDLTMADRVYVHPSAQHLEQPRDVLDGLFVVDDVGTG